jgi:Xaa-Pro aminopeptidase
MAARFAHRIDRARKAMIEAECDVLVVTNRENLIYFTGVTQIECLGLLIPRNGEACVIALWLDAEYVSEHSGLETKAYHFPRQNLGSTMVSCIKSFGLSSPRLGFERYFVDYGVYEALKGAFPENSFTGMGDLFYRLRAVKEPEEIHLIRKAATAVYRGMDAAVKSLRAGITELEVLAEAEYAMTKAGSWGSSFRPQVVSGDRTLLAHPTASEKVIGSGEVVVVHLGATCQGYCAKMARTAAVGEIPKAQKDTHALLVRALESCEAVLRPGATSGEVDAAAREVVENAGYGNCYLESVGYGVGLRQSEFFPIIGRGRNERIEAGMVVDLLLPTIYRKGVGGPRVTDVIHVGEEKSEVLTSYPRGLVQI